MKPSVLSSQLLALALGLAVGAGFAQESGSGLLGSGDGPFLPAEALLFGGDPRAGLRPWTLNRFLDDEAAVPAETRRGTPRFDPARDVLPLTNAGSTANPGGSCWGIVSLQSAVHQYFQQGRPLPAGLTEGVPELGALLARMEELGACGLREAVESDTRAAELAQVAAGKLMASQDGFPKPSPALDAEALAGALERDGYAMIAFALPPKGGWFSAKAYPTHAVQAHGAPRRVELTGPKGERATGTFFPIADSNSEWTDGKVNDRFGLVKLDGVRTAARAWTWVGAPVGRQRLCQDCYQPGEFYQDAGHLWLVPTRFWEAGTRDRSGRPAADYLWHRPPAADARAAGR